MSFAALKLALLALTFFGLSHGAAIDTTEETVDDSDFAASPDAEFEALTASSIPPIRRVTAAQWASLNSTVGGRLSAAHAFAAPCFSKFADNLTPVSKNNAKCLAVQQGWSNFENGQTSHIGGFANTQWQTCQRTNARCLLNHYNPSDPTAFAGTCSQGSVSQYYITVQGASDITAAYEFSLKTGVPLVVKNTGHDFNGRSSGPDSLSLWTHQLTAMTALKNYVPAGCAASQKTNAFRVGAGVQFSQAYKFADANGFTIVGGSAAGVGYSGGWLAGGGHSFLSPKYGLGVDNVVEVKVVVPKGGLITASRCQNTDVFFAVIGGGPASIGVVVESTHKTHPIFPVSLALMPLTITSNALAEEFIDLVVPLAPQLIKLGWGGGFALTNLIGQFASVALLNPSLSYADAIASMRPIYNFLVSKGLQAPIESLIIQMPSYYAALDLLLSASPTGELAPVGLPIQPGSRLLPESLWASSSSTKATAKAIKNALALVKPKKATDQIPGPLIQLGLVTPYSTPASGFTSETPAWRGSIMHVLIEVAWNHDSTEAYRHERLDSLNKATQYLRDLAPQSGAYANEAFVYEPDWQKTFYGTSNYNRLLTLKKKYDPNTLLNCHRCVGWKGDSDALYRCYEPNTFCSY